MRTRKKILTGLEAMHRHQSVLFVLGMENKCLLGSAADGSTVVDHEIVSYDNHMNHCSITSQPSDLRSITAKPPLPVM